MTPQRWRGGVYTAPDGFTNFTWVSTSPRNAIATARLIKTRGLRATRRLIDPDMPNDLAGIRRVQWANQLIRAARLAKKQRRKVGFVTEQGGYPWSPSPMVFTTPDDFFRSTLDSELG